MGFLDRLRAGTGPRPGVARPQVPAIMTATAVLREGEEDLEIVGEASYQEALWAICGGVPGERVRHDVVAALVPEPDPADFGLGTPARGKLAPAVTDGTYRQG